MKVLVADDDAYNLELLDYALRREGYTPVMAADGAQALRQFETERPSIVLLDINMPKLNGFEVCRRIRQDSEAPNILPPAREVRCGDLVLELDAHEVLKAGRSVQLTPLEFRILFLLAMNDGRVIPYS